MPDSETTYTTVRISKDFHTWIFDKGKKGESYDDVLQRISGYKPEIPTPTPVEPPATITEMFNE